MTGSPDERPSDPPRAGPPFELVGEDLVHDGYAIEVVTARYRAPDGTEFSRDVIHHVGAVAVLPVHDDGTATLVRQYRAPVGFDVLEIPAGLRDVDDEAPEVTAERELAEEVGLVADRLERLCVFHNAVGLSDEAVHVYRATGLRPVATDHQGPEEQHMRIERHGLDDLVAMIRAGEITDAKTVIAVLLVTRDG